MGASTGIDIIKIWDAVLSADAEGWRRLVSLYAGLVHTVALQAGLEAADAEDCAQLTWMTLYRKRHSINDPRALPAWLIRTTHRQAVHMARRVSGGKVAAEFFESTRSAPTLPSKVVERLETQAIIDIAMRQLDTRCQKVLHALYLSSDEPPYKEIARLVRVKPNSLGPLRSRCLSKLKKILENLGYDLD